MQHVGLLALAYVAIGVGVWFATGGLKASRDAVKFFGLTFGDILLLDGLFVLTWPVGLFEFVRGRSE